MCKLHNQEKRIWERIGLVLADRCTLEVAVSTIHNETDCPKAKECKKDNKDTLAWLEGLKHRKKKGKN